MVSGSNMVKSHPQIPQGSSKALIAGHRADRHRNLLSLRHGAGTAHVQLDLVPYGDVDHVVHDAAVRKDQPGRDVDIYRVYMHETVKTVFIYFLRLFIL